MQHSPPCAVSLAGEAFLKERQSKFKDLRVRGNRLLIYNQIIQPPKGITVEDTQVARLAFKMTDADENRWEAAVKCCDNADIKYNLTGSRAWCAWRGCQDTHYHVIIY